MFASAISSSCGESGITGTLSMNRSEGSVLSSNGSSHRPKVSIFHGMPVAIGGRYPNLGAFDNML